MRPSSRGLWLAFVLLLIPALVLAQGTSGTLTGTVTTDGAPLPGVSVTASSPALQGTRTAVTGENGSYSMPGLPPGDYTVLFELEGLQPVTRVVRVSLVQTARADAALRVSAIADVITVTASAPAVVERSQVGMNVTNAMLDQLPVGRTIAAAVSLAPGVSTGIAGFSIAGAPSYDNVYLVNGVVVNENLRGQPHNLFIEDAVQETTILTGGISAEYGRFTGGVISTITKSGGNEFSGSIRDNISNADWRRKTPHPTEADHIDELSHVYEATLGGFILRDRLWFFAAGRLNESEQQRFTTQTNLPYTFSIEETRIEGKLTGTILQNHSVVASYLDVADDRINDSQFVIMDRGSLFNRSLPNTLLAVQYNGVWTPNLLLEAQYSEKEFYFVGSGSQFRDRIFGTLMLDQPTGRRYWTSTFCGVCTDEGRNNDSLLAKGTYFLSTPNLGTHNLVFGAESYEETRIANNHQSGSDYRIFSNTNIQPDGSIFPVFNNTTIIQWNPIFNLSEGTDLQTLGVFVNDAWTLNNNFAFNLGVRYDKNDGKNADGGVVSDDSAFSPRLGIQYDIFGDGRHRINANYGRYVTKIADGNVAGAAQAAGNPSNFQWDYRGPAVNAPGSTSLLTTDQALAILWAWFDSVGGNDNKEFLRTASISGLSSQFPGSIRSPSVDEITLGYSIQIGRTAYLRTDLIAREWQDFYARRIDTSTPESLDQFGNRGDVGFIITDNSMTREYRGVQLQGQWRPGRAYTGGSYTWSELEGSDSSEAGPTATSPNTPLALFYPEYLGYAQRLPEGYLPGDVRHRLKYWLGYETPIPVIGTVNVSLLHTYESGSPYSAAGVIDATGRIGGTAYPGLPANPGYLLTQAGTSHTYFFSELGEFRTDDFNRTDLNVTWTLPIRRVGVFVQALVTNVFDESAVDNPDTTVFTRRNSSTRGLTAFNPFTTTPIECPRTANAATCSEMGAHWQKGPNFGQPIGVSSYQIPLTYSFTAGLRF